MEKRERQTYRVESFMSEKKFTTKNIVCSNYCVWDNNDKPYGNDELVDLLNEQQSIIEAKNEYQRTLEAKIRRLKDRIKVLEKNER